MWVDFDRLSQYHEQGKLRHSVDESRNLHVWCYSQATVFNREWDDLTRLCRGLVTDANGNVASRPFPKFFNWGEPLAPGSEITRKPFWAYDKLDGTLIIVGRDADGDVVVSTKGSFSTWHSEAARELLNGWEPVQGSTGIFELIHPKNRIVVDYGKREELVLLGAVANEDGCDHFTPENYADESGWFGAICPPQKLVLANLLNTVQDTEAGTNREGFVLLWPNPDGPSDRVKIKFAQYVHLHRVLSRLSNVAVWEALKLNMFDALLDVVPDEFYEQVRECSVDIQEAVDRVLADARVVVQTARTRSSERREQAAHILKHAEHSGICFSLLDGKDDAARAKAFDATKPARDESWTFLK
jgi:hypothetical protein